MCALPEKHRAKIIGIQDKMAMDGVLNTFSDISVSAQSIESLQFVDLYSQCVLQLEKDFAFDETKSCRVEVHIDCTSKRTVMIQCFAHSPIYRRRYSGLHHPWPFCLEFL